MKPNRLVNYPPNPLRIHTAPDEGHHFEAVSGQVQVAGCELRLTLAGSIPQRYLTNLEAVSIIFPTLAEIETTETGTAYTFSDAEVALYAFGKGWVRCNDRTVWERAGDT